MKKKDTLALLKKQLAETMEEWTRLRDAIEAIEVRERTPRLRALIGTCYRIRNSYGGGENWWLYRRITGVTDEGHLEYLDVQIDCHGKASVEGQNIGYRIEGIAGGATQISGEEFAAQVLLAKQRLGI